MFKAFKMKLIMTLVTSTAISGVSVTTLPMIHNSNTAVKESQASGVGESTLVDSSSAYEKENLKDSELLADEENKSDDFQDDTNEQKSVRSEKKSGSVPSTDTSETIDFQTKNSNSSINTESQSGTNTILESQVPTIRYDRTTSIYANDNVTLLRIEYYVNNSLIYYSVVEQFDATTLSYVEKIYQCNRETNINPLVRTDVYVHGNLVRSY